MRGQPNRNFGGALRNDPWTSRDPLWNDRFSGRSPGQNGAANGHYPPEGNRRPDRAEEPGHNHNGFPPRDNVGYAVNTAYNLSDRHIRDGRRAAENQYGRRYEPRFGSRSSPPYRRQFDPRFNAMTMDPTAQVSRVIGELIPLTTGLLSSLSAAACASFFPHPLANRMYPPMMNYRNYCERCGYEDCRCRDYCNRCGYYDCRCRRDWDNYARKEEECGVLVEIASNRSAKAKLHLREDLDLREYSAHILVRELKIKPDDKTNTLGTPAVITVNGISTIKVKIANDQQPEGTYEGEIEERKSGTHLGKLNVYVYPQPPP
jgi:hypothetical protein